MSTLFTIERHFGSENNIYIFWKLLTIFFDFLANICNSNLISLTDTSQYFNNTEETMDGHFTADHELVNGHKCYRRTDEPNTVMVWEVDVYGSGAWVIRNTVGKFSFNF